MMILSAFLLICLFSGCSNAESDKFDQGLSNRKFSKPEQEVLFIKEKARWSDGEGRVIFSTQFMDNEGNYYNLPSEVAGITELTQSDDWYERLIDIKENSEPTRKVETSDLNVIYEFAADSDLFVDLPLKDHDYTVYDYGSETVYFVYLLSDDTAKIKKLCSFGGSTMCADSDKVRDFMNWMKEKSYFTIGLKDFKY